MSTECQPHRLRLVEGGYERSWKWVENSDGTFIAVGGDLEDYTDDGDGQYVLRCRACGAEFPVPDEWEWD